MPIPEVTWETTAAYTAKLVELREMSIRQGKEAEFRGMFHSLGLAMAQEFLQEQNPRCARAGTIEPIGAFPVDTSYGPCRYPAITIMVLDEYFSGIVYSVTLVILASLTEEGDTTDWWQPGTALGTPEMEGGKRAALRSLAELRQTGINVNHAYVNVVMGSDMVTCKFDSTTVEPTINKIAGSQDSKEFKEMNREFVRRARKRPEEARGQFLPVMFQAIVHKRAKEHPGSTIWDEGEFPMSVKGVPYPHPTRLLVTRDFQEMSKEANATHFLILNPNDSPNTAPGFKLLRNNDPGEDPGGIVSISLLVALDPSVLWPVYGAYLKDPIMKAAEAALLEHVKKMYSTGKVQRCAVQVCMGADESSYLFVGDKQDTLRTAAGNEASHAAARLSSLEGFGIKLEEQKKHELFQSESHFQAIKEHMVSKARANPDHYKAMAPRIAVMTATHFLEKNFPGCVVTDEGEFPAVLPDGKEMAICDTRLVVARDPKQAPRDVIAVIHAVPCPGEGVFWMATPGKNWLETEEMKAAEMALLGLMKKWYKEGKISEVDCMAQVMMATDVSYYQFVDGERFVDYPDERNAQIRWQ